MPPNEISKRLSSSIQNSDEASDESMESHPLTPSSVRNHQEKTTIGRGSRHAQAAKVAVLCAASQFHHPNLSSGVALETLQPERWHESHSEINFASTRI